MPYSVHIQVTSPGFQTAMLVPVLLNVRAQSQTATSEAYNHVRPVPSPWTLPKVGIGQYHPIPCGTVLEASMSTDPALLAQSVLDLNDFSDEKKQVGVSSSLGVR